MSKPASEILDDVIQHWQNQVETEQFNGLKLQDLSRDYDDETLRNLLTELVTNREIDIISLYEINPHIKRFPAPNASTQLEYLNVSERYHTCIYPTSETVKSAIDLSSVSGKPFTKRLASSDAQLLHAAFEVSVIDRYRRDPRFSFYFNDYIGTASFSVAESEYDASAERDKTYIKSFGLALNDEKNPAVATFIRDLANLTPEHQQHWASYQLGSEYKICHQYYQASILGEWYTNRGATNALRHCVRIVNEASVQICGHRVFQKEIGEYVHFSVSSLMDNTTAELNAFYEELDKLVSENLDEKAMRSALTTDAPQEERGISLLKRLIEQFGSSWSAAETLNVILPLRKLRSLRSKSAHNILPNRKTNEVYQDRRKLFGDVIWSLGSIALLLAKHPKVQNIEVPEWLEACEIEIF
jgi:hypothetical protein